MTRNLLTFAFLCIATFGCSSFVTRVDNDPVNSEPSGDVAFIRVNSEDGKSLDDSFFGKLVRDQASRWLSSRGFKITEDQKLAHTTLVFVPVMKSRDVYVPGHTYSVPTYQNSSTTSTIRDSMGWKIGSVETAPANSWMPTGQQMHYQEGYTATIQDRWILIEVWRAIRGKPPERVSFGQAYPKAQYLEFFENQTTIRNAVQTLIEKTGLAKVDRAPASISNLDPGCWPRLGIAFEKNEKLHKGLMIRSFSQNSNAPSAGLKKGDTVLSIDGIALVNSPPLKKYSEGQQVSVVISRLGKEMTKEVPTAMICVD